MFCGEGLEANSSGMGKPVILPKLMGRLSGAHLNPVVSLAFALRGEFYYGDDPPPELVKARVRWRPHCG